MLESKRVGERESWTAREKERVWEREWERASARGRERECGYESVGERERVWESESVEESESVGKQERGKEQGRAFIYAKYAAAYFNF